MYRISLSIFIFMTVCGFSERAARAVGVAAGKMCAPMYSALEPLPAGSEPAFSEFIEQSGYASRDASIYRGDINNDMVEEWIYSYNAGSSGVLYVHVFRKTEEAWIRIVFPLDTWSGWGEQLFGSFSGDMIINLAGGTSGGRFRETYIWKDDAAEPYCREEWVTQQTTLASEFIATSRLASANGQLSWLTQACDGRLTEQQLIDISRVNKALESVENIAASGDFSWVRGHMENETTSYKLIRDPQFEPLITAVTNSRVFRDYLLTNLGGPSEIELQSDRYLSIQACRPHSCGDNGFLWLDLHSNEGIGAIVRYDLAWRNGSYQQTNHLAVVDSRYFDFENYPDEFLKSIKRTYGTSGIRLILHDGDTSLYDDLYW